MSYTNKEAGFYFRGTKEQVAELIEKEKERLSPGKAQRTNGATNHSTWTGIALSGGGIRAATFALGVMQALASRRVLKSMDYISTVSGGGYIGSSLQWWWSSSRYAEDKAEEEKSQQTQLANGRSARKYGVNSTSFPYGTNHFLADPNDRSEQDQNLDYLRNHGFYLTPGRGLNSLSVLAVVLRTVTLSLAVWFPLAVLMFSGLQGLDKISFGAADCFFRPVLDALLWPEFKTLFGKLLVANDGSKPDLFHYHYVYAVSLWLWSISVALFLAISVVFGLASRAADGTAPKIRFAKVVGALAIIGVLLFALWRTASNNPNSSDSVVSLLRIAYCVGLVFATSVIAFGLFPRYSQNWSYRFRRFIEISLGYLFMPSSVLLVIAIIPLPSAIFAESLYGSTPINVGIISIVSALSGTLSAVSGYYTLLSKAEARLVWRILIPIGSAIFIFGFLSAAYLTSIYAVNAAGADPILIGAGSIVWVRVFFGSLFVVSIVLFLTMNVNYVGLHRFYRDRLMEAFMPSYLALKRNEVRPSYVADRLQLSDITAWVGPDENSGSIEPTPYPLINCFAIFADDSDPKIAARGGANFILSPLYIGSDVTGWLDTKRYCESFGQQTLASAMAASGAAINSNAGYVGTGVTRNRVVSLVMTLLNMRLGIWTGESYASWRVVAPRSYVQKSDFSVWIAILFQSTSPRQNVCRVVRWW